MMLIIISEIQCLNLVSLKKKRLMQVDEYMGGNNKRDF